jgi:hypothetical protein
MVAPPAWRLWHLVDPVTPVCRQHRDLRQRNLILAWSTRGPGDNNGVAASFYSSNITNQGGGSRASIREANERMSLAICVKAAP